MRRAAVYPPATGRNGQQRPARRLAAAMLALLALGPAAEGQAATAKLTPRAVPVPLHGMVLAVPVGGDLSYPTGGDPAAVDGRLTADLAAAQRQATAILAALLNRAEPCGDHLAVRTGRLGARTPALHVVATVEYGRTACIAGRAMPVVPRALYDVDMLLHPLVAARSLRVRAEVLSLRAPGGGLPASVEAPMREMLERLVGERIGELLPKDTASADLVLKSVAFEEAKPGRLAARLDGSATLPRSMLDQLLRQR